MRAMGASAVVVNSTGSCVHQLHLSQVVQGGMEAAAGSSGPAHNTEGVLYHADIRDIVKVTIAL